MENLAVKKIKAMIAEKKMELATKKEEENKLLNEKIEIFDELIEVETNIKYKEDIAISFEVHPRLNRVAKIFGIVIFALEGLIFNIGVFPEFNSTLLYILGNVSLALISYVCYKTVISENLKNMKMYNLDEVNSELSELRKVQEEIEKRLSLNESKMRGVLDVEQTIKQAIKEREEALYQVSNFLVAPAKSATLSDDPQVRARKQKEN